MQHWQGAVLICQQELCSGMNILQPLTIHTSIQIRPFSGHQETNPDVCVAGPVSTPPSTGTEVFKPCQPLLFSSSNLSCTQVVTFLYGRLSFCSGTAPEGKAEGTIKAARESPRPAKQIRKWALYAFPLGVVQLVSPLSLSEGLFVLFDSALDACAGGRWFIQLRMLARAACAVMWGCITTS